MIVLKNNPIGKRSLIISFNFIFFIAAIYSVPILKLNATLLIVAFAPFYLLLIFKYSVVNVSFCFMLSFFSMIYIVMVTFYYGFTDESKSIFNIVFYFSVAIVLSNLRFSKTLSCYIYFFYASILLYIYEAIFRFYMALSSGANISSFYVFKFGGAIFNDSNVVGMTLLFLYVVSRELVSKFEMTRSRIFKISIAICLILIFLSFSRAAILTLLVFEVYLLVKKRGHIFRIMLVSFLVASFQIVFLFLTTDESFMSKFSILNAFFDYINGIDIYKLLFGVGVRSWGDIYDITGLNINNYDFVGHILPFSLISYGGVIYLLLMALVLAFHLKYRLTRGLIFSYAFIGLSYLELYNYMFWILLAFASALSVSKGNPDSHKIYSRNFN